MPPNYVPQPPIAPRKPSVHVAHGDTRTDDWQWLADKQDQAVVAYLQAENAYADFELSPTVPLQDKLFGEIRARIAETDISTPVFHEGWWYWSRTLAGQQYPVHCRRADPSKALSAAEVLAAARAALPGAGIAGDGTPPPQGANRPMVEIRSIPGRSSSTRTISRKAPTISPWASSTSARTRKSSPMPPTVTALNATRCVSGTSVRGTTWPMWWKTSSTVRPGRVVAKLSITSDRTRRCAPGRCGAMP